MTWCDSPIFTLGPGPVPNPYAVVADLECATFIKKPLLFHHRYSSISAISSPIQIAVLILTKGTRCDESRVLAELYSAIQLEERRIYRINVTSEILRVMQHANYLRSHLIRNLYGFIA